MAPKRPEGREPTTLKKSNRPRLRLATENGEPCEGMDDLFATPSRRKRSAGRAPPAVQCGSARGGREGGGDSPPPPGRFPEPDDDDALGWGGGGGSDGAELEAELEAVIEYLIAVEGRAAVPAIFDIVTRTVRRRLGGG